MSLVKQLELGVDKKDDIKSIYLVLKTLRLYAETFI